MIVRFGMVSGIGWLIDFFFFSLLVFCEAPVWGANLVGGSIAVLFVFFASVRHVFEHNGQYILGKLITYIMYQVLAILTASLLIDILTEYSGLVPVLSKIVFTPLTFYANFQFMSFITTGKFRLL